MDNLSSKLKEAAKSLYKAAEAQKVREKIAFVHLLTSGSALHLLKNKLRSK